MNNKTSNSVLHTTMTAADNALDSCLDKMGLPSNEPQIEHFHQYQLRILLIIALLISSISFAFVGMFNALLLGTSISSLIGFASTALEQRTGYSIFKKIPFYTIMKKSHDYRKTVITNELEKKETQYALLHYLELIEEHYGFKINGKYKPYYNKTYRKNLQIFRQSLFDKKIDKAYNYFLYESLWKTIKLFRNSSEYREIFGENEFQHYKEKLLNNYSIHKHVHNPHSHLETEKSPQEKIKDML